MNGMSRVLRWTLGVGAAGFIPGFFGPMLLAPGANQGPLLGILITGPIGLVLGLGIGLWREWRPPRGESPVTGLPSLESLLAHPLARVIAALLALILLVHGIQGLRAGAGRGAAAAVVIAIVAGWFCVTGKFPGWAR